MRSQSAARQVVVTLLLSSMVQMRLAHDLPDLTSPNECHRFSLDALAYQFYLPQAEKDLNDLKVFVDSALDSLLGSVQQLMSMLPGKDKSDSQDVRVRSNFDLLRRGMEKVVKGSKKNLTLSWEEVIQANQGFLNRTHHKPHVLLDSFRHLAATYEGARSATARQLAVALLQPLKELLKRSAQSLDQLKQSRKILSELMPNFLGALTVHALGLKVDLNAPVRVPDIVHLHTSSDAQDWSQMLGKEHFAVQLLEAEMRVLVSERRSKSPERLELSRRDVSVHWTHVAYDILGQENREAKSKGEDGRRKEPDLSDQLKMENRVLSLLRLYS